MVFFLGMALAAPRVLGGEPVPEGRYPDAVALFAGDVPVCTGTLITPDLVLSAEHCYGITTAKVGVVDQTTGASIDVIDRYDHPNAPSTYDVSVFRLAEPASQQPRPLLLDCLTDLLVDGTPVVVAGFGYRDASGPGQDLLIEATIEVDDADCSDLSRGCRPQVSPGGELVAGGDGVDSCIGDSGGPLYLDTGVQTVLAGVVSRGAFPAAALCGEGGIYVRADAIAPWIEASTGAMLERPVDCADVNLPPAPIVTDLEVTQGRSVSVDLDPNDPDPDDTHTIEVIEAPTAGWLSDALVYTAEPFQIGADRMVLEVTDSGSPPRSARVEVQIRVFPAGVLDDPVDEVPVGCGCRTGSGASGMLTLGILALLRRQRSSQDRPSSRS